MPDGSSTMSGSLKARLHELWLPMRRQVALKFAGTGGFNELGATGSFFPPAAAVLGAARGRTAIRAPIVPAGVEAAGRRRPAGRAGGWAGRWGWWALGFFFSILVWGGRLVRA